MIGSARAQVAATLVFVASVLLVITQAPMWSVLIALGCAVWRLLLAMGRIEASPPTRTRGLVFSGITVLMVLAVLVSFRTLNGLAAGLGPVAKGIWPLISSAVSGATGRTAVTSGSAGIAESDRTSPCPGSNALELAAPPSAIAAAMPSMPSPTVSRGWVRHGRAKSRVGACAIVCLLL